MDEKTKNELLTAIESAGNTASAVHLNGNRNHVISLSSGVPRIQNNVVNKFEMIFNQPSVLKSFNNLEVRCVVCSKVIHYPAWYYCLKLAVNEFHYFVCFSKLSPNRPSTHCIRKG